MNTQKNISFRIPVSVDWNEEDLIKKAEKLGMNKSEFIMKAVDTFINFDDSFIELIDNYADDFRIPPYIVIQNFIIDKIAREGAEDVVFNQQKRIRKEFIIASDSCYYRMMTGQALWEYLFDLYVKELRQKKDEQNTEANNG